MTRNMMKVQPLTWRGGRGGGREGCGEVREVRNKLNAQPLTWRGRRGGGREGLGEEGGGWGAEHDLSSETTLNPRHHQGPATDRHDLPVGQEREADVVEAWSVVRGVVGGDLEGRKGGGEA